MFPGDITVLQAPTVFIRFIAESIFQVVFTVCRFQRFLFCLSPYLFSEWHIVPLLCIQIKQSRVHSRKALYECKASRRLGKQMRGLSRFLSTLIQQLPQYTRRLQPQPIYSISKEKAFCFAFCRGKICKIQLFDITLPHH